MKKPFVVIDNERNTSLSEKEKLIQGGEQMKYKGITIHRHKSCSTWYTRYRDKNGKQIYISAKTQQECYNKLKTALNKELKEKTKELKKKSITLIEWYNIWLATYKTKVTDNTKRDYQFSLKHLENLQNKEIDKITSIEIMQTLNKIKASRTKQKAYEFLVMLFKKAYETDKIEKNPMLAVDKPEYKRKNGEVFTIEDERTFIKICKTNEKYDMFLVALYQGLRRGELLAITDKDIDFKNKTLNINKSLQYNGTFGKTKNESDRVQPLFEQTIKILEKYKDIKGRIFNIDYNSCGDLFNEIRDKHLTKKTYKFKTLRFTFITKCGENNIPEHIIQKWVGHNIGSQITKQVYTKVRKQAEIENIEKINKLNSD